MSEILCVDDLASRLNKSRWRVNAVIRSAGMDPSTTLPNGLPAFNLNEVIACSEKFDIQRRNFMLLHLLESKWNDPTFDAAMGESQACIRRAQARMHQAIETGNKDYGDDVCIEEMGLIDSLIGTAFVTAQTFLTGVISSVIRLSARITPKNVVSLPRNKSQILKCPVGRRFTNGYTIAEAVNAFANYSKHNAEWPRRWSDPSAGTQRQREQCRETVQVISAFGATDDSSANLRNGLEDMGYSRQSVVSLGEDLQEWCRLVPDHIGNVLRSGGLI